MILRNLCLNPSMELSTSGWVAAGGATFARSASTAYRGTYSGLIGWPNGAVIGGARVDYAASLVVGRTYSVSVWVYVPNAASLAAAPKIYVAGSGFSANTVTAVNQWQRIARTFVAATNSVTISVTNSGAIASAGQSAYIDCVQIEETLDPTVYFDGSTTPPWPEYPADYRTWWVGAEHASMSVLVSPGDYMMTLDGSVILPIVLVDWSDEWVYAGELAEPLSGGPAIDIRPSTAAYRRSTRMSASALTESEAITMSAAITATPASPIWIRSTYANAPRTVLTRVTRMTRRPDPASIAMPQRWLVTAELVEVTG